MKCQILFSGKNKKNISKCRLLKILPRVLSVKEPHEELPRIFSSRLFHNGTEDVCKSFEIVLFCPHK